MPRRTRIPPRRLAPGLGVLDQAEIHPSHPVDLEELDSHRLSLAEHVADVPDVLFGHPGNVAQPLLARKELDEGPEVHQATDRAFVPPAHLGLRHEILDGRLRLFGFGLLPGVDGHRSVVVHVDGRPGAFGNPLDHLSSGPDDCTDLVWVDLHGDDLGGVVRDRIPGLPNGLPHDLEDVQPPTTGLIQRRAQHLVVDTADLDVHLEPRNAVGGPRNLEVHVPEMVLLPEDVRKHHVAVPFAHQTHGDSGHGLGDRHAGVEEAQRTAAHGGHGRRAVGFQDLGNNPDGVGKSGLSGHDGSEGTLGQVSMPDLPAARPQPTGLSDRKRREVVVQHEGLSGAAFDVIHDLLVEDRAQGRDHQGLGLSSSEQRRAVRPGQKIDLAGDGPDVLRSPPVGTELPIQDRLADDRRFQLFEDVPDLAVRLLGDPLPEALDCSLVDVPDRL